MTHGDELTDLGPLTPGDASGRSDQTSKQYLRLRADILDGKFPQGAALHETQLVESYGASRTPIREALNWLAHDGLLERAARGFRVRSGTPEDVIEIYAARVALESEAAGAAALRHTDLDMARLERLHDSCCHAADDVQVRSGNFRFHEALWQAAHNTTITSLLIRLTTQLRIYDSGPPSNYGEPDLLNTEHNLILEAIRARDERAAREHMRTHLERSREQRIRLFANG
ncbi:GntR family transcriptional regulator [Rhodococcus sp. TAF43]|uniref:GntR family transcriptional regulator n=1 Tax=unclassified Rhodococcus (in: high G+C Gram-positive bacteria) TaxID=192944 RepID=UPI000E09EC93|nr:MULTISPECIES: GntR family transcriptional regulator [unclassified Rhodococcus (in: high G+C Gram-positive bacteria)]QKT12100.1 GntR family transcriptional regulator [Rhodococcus sp. W8901]RDI32528.1 DNA-binding GntR family transcriptional regulator [Rhodococcus sp. AG1013]